MRYKYRLKYKKHNEVLTMTFTSSEKYAKKQAIEFAKKMSNTIDESCVFIYVAIIDEHFKEIEVL